MEDIKTLVKENKQHLVFFSLIIMALAVILIGILGCRLPMIPVCIFVVLEAGLALCLQDLPIWLHGAVLIAQLIIGLLFGSGMFVLLCAVYYVVNILILSIVEK